MKKTNVAQKKAKPKEKARFWSILLPYMKPFRKNLIFAMLFSVLTGLFVAVQPFIIKYIVDTGISGDPIEFFGKTFFEIGPTREERNRFILIACGLYIFVAAGRMSCWGLGLTHVVKAMEGLLFSLRSQFFGHVQRLCMRFYDKNSSGELFNYIMGSPMNNIKNYLKNMVQSVPYQAVSLFISLFALFSYSWQLTLITLATSVVMTVLYRMARNKMRRVTRHYLSTESEASKYISDVLHGSEAIKMYSIEDDTIHRFDSYIMSLRNSGTQLNMTSFLEHIKPEFTQYVGIACVYLVGGFLCL
ncbi:MAG: ABC transporter ATP-binding protein, partial [Clostridia bacterium]|nr:ABC transporter ATP-binding protein [Clostridia bacterium]